MKVLLGWLKEFVKFNLSPEELAEKLAMAGIDTEGISYLSPGLKKVVVGKIEKIRPHPKADRLVLCDVDIDKKVVQIVCGAKNMKEKDEVAVALPGAVLPYGIKIEKTCIRGEESFGMMCSEKELGVGEDASGILILDRQARVGEDIEKALGLDDVVIDFEVTPNRPDCMGIIGMAREVAAVLGSKFKVPKIKLEEAKETASSFADVKIVNSSLCPRYVARVITDVVVGTSPWWMKMRLEAAGLRPISNVVDITNYVMLETGQPLHAFDYGQLKGAKIVVRKAKKGETLLTLDGVLRQLDELMLVIADEKVPVALAGVMGGLDSEVSEQTKTVLLESAYFNPQSVGSTARKLGMLSEASARFERGTDPNNLVYAANRAAELMRKLGKGRILKGVIDVYPKKIKPRVLYLRPARVNEILGTELLSKKITNVLKSLDLKVEPETAKRAKRGAAPLTRLKVTVPTFRPDLEREIDLIEEVARLYGFNRIVSTLPKSSGKQGGLTFEQKVEGRVKETLISCGLFETINYSFIDPLSLDKLRVPVDSPLRNFVRLKNPVTEEQSVMRTTLILGLLSTIKLNINRGEENIHIFEIGRVFYPKPASSLPNEVTLVSAALTGSWVKDLWSRRKEQ